MGLGARSVLEGGGDGSRRGTRPAHRHAAYGSVTVVERLTVQLQRESRCRRVQIAGGRRELLFRKLAARSEVNLPYLLGGLELTQHGRRRARGTAASGAPDPRAARGVHQRGEILLDESIEYAADAEDSSEIRHWTLDTAIGVERITPRSNLFTGLDHLLPIALVEFPPCLTHRQ